MNPALFKIKKPALIRPVFLFPRMTVGKIAIF